ncbi:DegT/DnrJ/EryC1/StrS family aminotransferase [Bacteroidota bacterium]
MIPVCQPLLGGKELEYVTNCLQTNWISSIGRYVNEFEECFANYCGCKYGIATTSGTTALHLAIASLELNEGDEVIVPTFTNAASAFSVIYAGLKPVFVDAEPETLNIDVTLIKAKLSKRTKAIMPIHIYGHPCDMDPILEIAKEYGLYVIEDAAEAHGAEYKGRRTGGIGDVNCFSFYGNKIITTGEGGMVVTNNAVVAEKARQLKNLGYSSQNRYCHEDVGFNYRMTNVQAAIGLAQFECIDEYVAMRRQNALLYNHLLNDVSGICLPMEKEWAKNVYWMYAITITDEFGMIRDELMAGLKEKGVETRRFFTPMNRQPALHKIGICQSEGYPVADKLSLKGLYLPSGSGLLTKQIEYVCQSIRELRGD